MWYFPSISRAIICNVRITHKIGRFIARFPLICYTIAQCGQLIQIGWFHRTLHFIGHFNLLGLQKVKNMKLFKELKFGVKRRFIVPCQSHFSEMRYYGNKMFVHDICNCWQPCSLILYNQLGCALYFWFVVSILVRFLGLIYEFVKYNFKL